MPSKTPLSRTKKKVQIVSTIFNDDMLETLKEHFDSIDVDHSGSIDQTELKQLYENLGIYATEDQIQDLLSQADQDNNGNIDFEEFIRALEGDDSSVKTVAQTCENVFPTFDRDDDGFVTAADIFEVCKANKGSEQHITLEECRQMVLAIKEACEDKSVEERISKEQFKQIMEYDFNS